MLTLKQGQILFCNTEGRDLPIQDLPTFPYSFPSQPVYFYLTEHELRNLIQSLRFKEYLRQGSLIIMVTTDTISDEYIRNQLNFFGKIIEQGDKVEEVNLNTSIQNQKNKEDHNLRLQGEQEIKNVIIKQEEEAEEKRKTKIKKQQMVLDELEASKEKDLVIVDSSEITSGFNEYVLSSSTKKETLKKNEPSEDVNVSKQKLKDGKKVRRKSTKAHINI